MKAGILMLAFVTMLAAALVPLCGTFCCMSSAPTSMHAMMPCCAGESSMTGSDAMRVQRGTFTAAHQAPQPVAAIVTLVSAPPTPPVRSHSPRVVAPHEPSPPLFLLNAQFLI